jgi:TonB family protein
MKLFLPIVVCLSLLSPIKAFAQSRSTAGSYPAASIFKFVEKMPEFKGNLSAFLSSTLRYPESARLREEEGRAIVQFVVRETGKVTDVELVRSSGSSSLDSEALRAVSLMPDWKPGEQQGQPVNVYFTLPVSFKLDPAEKKGQSIPAGRIPETDGIHSTVDSTGPKQGSGR